MTIGDFLNIHWMQIMGIVFFVIFWPLIMIFAMLLAYLCLILLCWMAAKGRQFKYYYRRRKDPWKYGKNK